ncbi:MAG TPA: hypothetical protein VFE96_06780 [Candidatus Bathyarchaeia archaeon]|nr:hypothetical protein [Candidatus Bathyarchaeia archaeon]
MPTHFKFDVEETENFYVVTRMVAKDKDEEGNPIFGVSRICREDYPTADREIRASLDLLLEQWKRDQKQAQQPQRPQNKP